MKERSKRGGLLFSLASRHPWLVLSLALLLSALSLWYTSQRMEFLTGRDDLMPKNTWFHQDFRDFRAEFGDMEDIVVVIESADAERAGAFGNRLFGALAKEEKEHFSDLFYPYALPFFQQNGLLFMPLEEIKELHGNLSLAAPVLTELSRSPKVETLFTYLTASMNRYVAGEQSGLAGIVFMLDKLGAGFTSFGGGKGGTPSLDGFFMSSESAFAKAGRQQVLTALPVRKLVGFVPAGAAISVIRAEIGKLKALPEFKGVTVGLTGSPVLENEEMATSQKDIALATVVSLVLTIILLLLAFRGVLNVFAAMVSLLVAISLSFGFATAAVGHLNILSMVFAIMLIGIGIEYGIQLVLRYQEELKLGNSELEAIQTGLNRNVWAIVMAAATVAAAFLTFIFTDFKGIAELGIIAAGGVAICVAVTFTVLPAMLVLLARHRKPRKARGVKAQAAVRTGRLHALAFGRPKLVIAVTAVCCAASLFPLSRISFDYNLMNLQAKGLESVTYAYKLMKSKENAGYFAVVTADNASEAAAKTRALEALPTVDHVVSVNSFVPDRQEEKLAELAAIRRELGGVNPAKYEDEVSLMELPTVFENFRNATVQLKAKLEKEKRPEAKPVGAFLAILDGFFAGLEKERDRNAVGMLQDFQGGLFRELPEKIGLLKESLNAAPVRAADIPAELRSRFVGKTGKLMLQVAPKAEIFDLKPLKAFLDDVRSVDPRATGEPVMLYESMTIMRDAYRLAFLYAFAAIVVILLVAFRSVKFALIGLIPLMVGVLFMIAGMWLCGISFNSANIIVMPLVLGIAVDSGIYIINRFRREDGSAASVVTSSTGVGVLLNTLTIMASFGALMVAHHQGVFSIGVVMSLGMVACQIAFMVTLPAVLTLAGKK